MSNAHCDRTSDGVAFFVAQGGEYRQIKSVTSKVFTPDPRGRDYHSGRPDAAVFNFEKELAIKPLRLASAQPRNFKSLFVYAATAGEHSTQRIIKRFECQLNRHEAEFPYDITESPDVIHAYGCRLNRGLSGAPLFAPGNEEEVQAIQMGIIDPEERAKVSSLSVYQRHWATIATNARCLNNDANCLAVEPALTGKRFRKTQINELLTLRRPRIDMFQTKPRYFLLTDGRYEVIHSPVCGPENPLDIPFMAQVVRLQFDQWAHPRLEALAQNIFRGSIESQAGDAYSIYLNWPAPAATYSEPDTDLRKTWGPRFRIDLAQCPR